MLNHCSALLRRSVIPKRTSKVLLSFLKPVHPVLNWTLSFQKYGLATIPPTQKLEARDVNEQHLKAIPIEALHHIKLELAEADQNNDGRLDAEELKNILKKHRNAFSDEDVVRLVDLFYVAKAGGSLSHESFMDAVTNAYSTAQESNVKRLGCETSHRRTSIDRAHPLGLSNAGTEFRNGEGHLYSKDELDVKLTHVEPKTMIDRLAHLGVRVVRLCFDLVSLWKFGEITQAKVMRRVIFLETVAAIPGFVAAMVRHFKSLRTFSRDGGFLQMFLDEANNERMHLLVFVKMRDPSTVMRFTVLFSQTFVGALFFVVYNMSPALCHRFVGYIEEEACHTYTDIINCVQNAREGTEMAQWRTELAPDMAKAYWHLGEKGTVLDMLYAIRADEAEHRDVNHTCSGMKEGEINPFYIPQDKFDEMLSKYVKDIMKM